MSETMRDLLVGKEEPTIVLTLEGGSELECACLTVFDVNEKEYIALFPLTDNEDEDILLYRYHENSDDDWDVEYIEDDEEYEIVCDFFDQMLDDAEYEENYGGLD